MENINLINKYDLKFLKTAHIFKTKGDKGFYVLPEEIAEITNLVENNTIMRNKISLIIDELNKNNKSLGQEAFKWLNENNLIHLLD